MTPKRPTVAVAALVLLVAPVAAQDRIILRDTKVVTGAVTALTPDGITIDVGGKPTPVGWDEVEAGKVGNQAEFDKLLKEIGDPLFRVRQRLKTGDYREAAGPAEKLFPTFAERASGVADTVCVATAFGRLANNKREAAAEAFVCALAVRAREGYTADPRFATLNNRRLTPDPKFGAWAELPPVWFDPAAAKAELPKVAGRLKAWPGGKPPLAAVLYALTLAMAAEDAAAAAAFERDFRGFPGAVEWGLVIDAQKEVLAGKPGDGVTRLDLKLDELPEPVRMVGTYWVGAGRLLDPETKRRGVVWLLHLPARYADVCPDLAAAGLYLAAKAMDELKDARGAVTLRGELLAGFRQTYHGAKLVAETAPPKKDGP